MVLQYEKLTSRVIAAAIEVHRRLDPGFIESIYEHALAVELHKRGLKVEEQVEVPIEYEGVEVGRHRLDLLVEGTIVVELKAIKNLDNIHFAIVKSYLRAIGKEHGLLLNFAKPRKLEFFLGSWLPHSFKGLRVTWVTQGWIYPYTITNYPHQAAKDL
jgi:GxxExxY protein